MSSRSGLPAVVKCSRQEPMGGEGQLGTYRGSLNPGETSSASTAPPSSRSRSLEHVVLLLCSLASCPCLSEQDSRRAGDEEGGRAVACSGGALKPLLSELCMMMVLDG